MLERVARHTVHQCSFHSAPSHLDHVLRLAQIVQHHVFDAVDGRLARTSCWPRPLIKRASCWSRGLGLIKWDVWCIAGDSTCADTAIWVLAQHNRALDRLVLERPLFSYSSRRASCEQSWTLNNKESGPVEQVGIGQDCCVLCAGRGLACYVASQSTDPVHAPT